MPDSPAAPGDGSGPLVVTGEVDIASVEELLVRAHACLDAAPASLEIDLGGVTFIDSSGLGALVSIRNDAAARETDVVLVNLPLPVRRLFEVSGLDQVFDIRADA